MNQFVAALRGHALWVRNYAASPSTYAPPHCTAETFDRCADEIERLQRLLAMSYPEHMAEIERLHSETTRLKGIVAADQLETGSCGSGAAQQEQDR